MKPFHYAVMGNPIAHSLSPQIQKAFADQVGMSGTFQKILVPLTEFESYVHDFFAKGGTALNVTSPFKQKAFVMADIGSERAKKAQAANTLWMEGNKLYADNTDGIGFLRDLQRHVELKNKHILILGAGGATKAILAELLSIESLRVTVANRSMPALHALQAQFPTINCRSLHELTDAYQVIIRAISAEYVFSPRILIAHPFCYDLSYDVDKDTSFVAWAKNNECDAVDGIGMLHEQAAEAFYVWYRIKVGSEPRA